MLQNLLNLDYMYFLTGLLLIVISIYTCMDKNNPARYTTALFWTLFGLTFMAPIVHLPNFIVGIFLIVMAVLSGGKMVRLGSYKEPTPHEREKEAERRGNSLFMPILIIPIVTFVVAQFTKLGALVGLALASIAAIIVAMIMLREGFSGTMEESRRLVDSISTAATLPQLLAALGAVFNAAGVGTVVAGLISSVIPVNIPLATLIAYFLGMSIFTIIMGNAFAAFAVITTGIGIPLVVQMHSADPAILGVLGMLAGYCGTLVTPMAANFNIVPVALLNMKDTFGVIKKQIPVAVLMWISILIFGYIVLF
ncbi:DUF979 domain-containing protein [Calorimonas adulescens]|uniref:DUF979 domain-containing protein n=1 Tax=Calorimonas adulescens TaxID=2606906 RepID=A0A5D8QCZ7_9THEO|nr:DUF979 domain-containing protein [Calorimonas adulescens]TZE82402.1 DUF979 domain-containing protein [Calorimonas adulescens]